jgi:hypothetical protein
MRHKNWTRLGKNLTEWVLTSLSFRLERGSCSGITVAKISIFGITVRDEVTNFVSALGYTRNTQSLNGVARSAILITNSGQMAVIVQSLDRL